jgi:hypothetical protein
MLTRDEWRARLERQLGPRTDRITRNQAITLCYARWYLQEPWLFKWAGMAAFASDQVGIALALSELVDAPHGMVGPAQPQQQGGDLLRLGAAVYGRSLSALLALPLALHDATSRLLLQNDLDLVRQANDAIFEDVGWAHLAYISAGIGALEACLHSDEDASLLEAFRMLDEGAHTVCDPARYEAGTDLIRGAAMAMLRREQMTILPRFMERMSVLGRVFASFGAWLDFEGGPALLGQPSFSGYYGPLAVMLGLRSVTRAEDRWEWIERDVQTRWATVDEAYREGGAMHRRLVGLAKERSNLLQQTAGLMRRAYPALALRPAPSTVPPFQGALAAS